MLLSYPAVILILWMVIFIKKKKIEIPEFESENDLRDYLINITLEIVVNLKEQALKKGNVRKAPVTNAKMSQYRVALESIKILNSILKDKEINQLSLKIQNLVKGLIAVNNQENELFELSTEIKKELEKFEVIHESL